MASQIKEKLAASLVELLNEKPLSRITVRDISDHCGVTRQAFYHYFHTRDELIRWIYEQNLSIAYRSKQLVTWDVISLRLLEILSENKELYRHMVQQSDDDTLEMIMESYTADLYGRIIRISTGSDPDEQMKLLLHMYSVGGIRTAIYWVRSGMKKTPLEMRDLFRAAMPPRVAEALTTHAVPVDQLRVASL